MNTPLSLLVLTLVLMLSTPTDISSAEKMEHHGQAIDLDGDIGGCIACHDGTIATSFSFCLTKCNYRTSHSVTKTYPPHGQENAYAPISSLSGKGIQLHNGKTTCLSCHDLKNQEKYHLIIDNRGSSLCFTCHISQ